MRTVPYICFTIVLGVIVVLAAVDNHMEMERIETQLEEVETQPRREDDQTYDDGEETDPASYFNSEKIELLYIEGGENVLRNEETDKELSEGYMNVSVTDDQSLSRKRRGACPVPSDKHASFDCEIGKCSSCTQTCVWGYKVRGRRSITRKCSCRSGGWIPPFEPCKRWARCNLKMVSAGKIKCSTNHMDHGPRCKISCGATKRNPAVRMCNTECKGTGRWSPPLPHCVRAV